MFYNDYTYKKKTVKEALGLINSGDYISIGSYGNEPIAFLRELHTIADNVENVKMWNGILNEDYPFVMDLALTGKIDSISTFYSTQHRKLIGTKHVDYFPTDLRNAAWCMLNHSGRTVFVAAVSPMNAEGYFSLCFSLTTEYEIMNAADLIILEVNKRLPNIPGMGQIHISKVACIYEADIELNTVEHFVQEPRDEVIGENVASLIKDGDTLQFGFGSVPEYVGKALSRRKDLGIHTEMLSNALGMLIENGNVNNSKKSINEGKSVCGFVYGSNHLYDFLSGYKDLALMPASYVNNPNIIAQNDNMVSINTAIQLDLTGQICSESIGSQQFSGTGGAFDFACGAYHSKGGRGIIAIRSSAKNDSLSKISSQLPLGSVVSISRNIVDYVVTEYGIAHLRGQSIRQRAIKLIEIAHPYFRKELTKQAHDLLLW